MTSSLFCSQVRNKTDSHQTMDQYIHFRQNRENFRHTEMSRWIHAILVSTLAITASAYYLRIPLQPSNVISPEKISEQRADVPIAQGPYDDRATDLPLPEARFHQFPYKFPYLYYTNALSAVQSWKKPTTSSTTTPTTTTAWDDWED